MALYFYFNETTGDLVYSDKTTYSGEGYTSLGEQTNLSPVLATDWIFNDKRSSIITVTKDIAVTGKIIGLKNMSNMFYNCSGTIDLDLSGFDTSQVTSMSNVFYNCSGITDLDLSGFDTSQVTSMNGMFFSCSSLTSLDLSVFDTSQVTDMNNMFYGCYGITDLDLSGFDTSQVTNMVNMFSSCSGLTSLDLSEFDTSQVTDISRMFQYCSNLTSLDLSGFNTSQVTNTYYMFRNCKNLRLLTISGNMSNVLSALPFFQYYPAVGGDPVAAANLTAGTWVRDEADLSTVTSIVEQAQMSQAISRRIGKLNRDLRAEIAKASADSSTPSVDVVRTDAHSTSYTRDTLEIVTDSSGKVTAMYFVTVD